MAANVESMFYVRETPWHGLGTKVQEAPTSKDALILAGLDWSVVQEPVYTGQNELVQGYKANVRDSDRKVLGVVTDRYKIVQNGEAFSFTDERMHTVSLMRSVISLPMRIRYAEPRIIRKICLQRQ